MSVYKADTGDESFIYCKSLIISVLLNLAAILAI